MDSRQIFELGAVDTFKGILSNGALGNRPKGVHACHWSCMNLLFKFPDWTCSVFTIMIVMNWAGLVSFGRLDQWL